MADSKQQPGRLTRRAVIAGAGGATLAAPLLAQQLIDLGLPGGPSARPLEPAFPGKGEMIVQRIRAPLLETLADFADMLQVDAPNAGGIRLYEASMSDFPGNLMDRAAAKVARNHRFSRLPLAADFHKAIVPELEWIRAKRSWVSFLLSYFNRAIALKAAQERHNK